MKVLIYGANGWIGSQFAEFLTIQNIEWIPAKSRASDIIAVTQELESHQPTNVISFIGRTHGVYDGTPITTIDYLEKPGKLDENVRDNLFSPMVLALVCKQKDIHFSYLGTGCIFEYDSKHTTENGFTEDSLPNFKGSSYSLVKGYTDQLIPLVDALNLRIRMPITGSKNTRNFITKITSYEKICSIPNSMTVLTDFYPVWLEMMLSNVTGTFNCTNPGVISHNEILEMYREIVDPNFTWKNFSVEEQNEILASKRSNNYLETEKLTSMYNVPNIKESVRNMLYEYCS